MPEPFILVLCVVALVVLYGVGRWAAGMEERAVGRRLLARVYYPGRGKNAEQQALARRQRRSRGDDGEPSDE